MLKTRGRRVCSAALQGHLSKQFVMALGCSGSRSLSFAEAEIEMHSNSRGSPRDGASQGEMNHKLQMCRSGYSNPGKAITGIAPSEREHHLQIDAAVCRLRIEHASGQRGRLAKKSGTQVPDRRTRIDFVED